MSGERCQRCGVVSPDLRTLWMACFYQMEELGLPLELIAVHGHVVQQKGVQRFKGFEDLPVPVWEDPEPSQEPGNFQFYRLRVCKDCRADWMGAIRDWFNSVPDHFVTDSPDANIPVRIDGRVKMLTREQYDEFSKEEG